MKKLFDGPTLKGLPLKTYSTRLSLDRLRPGIDNVRYDVLLSPDFSRALRAIVRQVIAKHLHAEDELNRNNSVGLAKDIEQFQISCRELILAGISKAKLMSEVQVDYLAQVSLLKLLIGEIQKQFRKIVDHYKSRIRGYEVTSHHEDANVLQKRMSVIVQYKNDIISAVGRELLQYVRHVEAENLDEMRRFTFGEGAVLPEEFFSNPMLYVEKASEDFFTLKEYEILLGHRMEDPDKYEAVLTLYKNFFHAVHGADLGLKTQERLSDPDFLGKLEDWTRVVENVDLLFNCFQNQYQYRQLKGKNSAGENVKLLKSEEREWRKRLCFVYKQFKNAGILEKIVACYEMQPLYLDYCPPLVPQLISQFFISRQGRKNVITRLKRLKKFYGESLSITPLRLAHKQFRRVRRRKAKGYLIRFLKDFVRFHRDLHNLETIRKAMERIQLVTDKSVIELSRTNNTLYEFLLPHEQVSEGSPIVGHVIIKADVRGSTDITHQMMRERKNPASYFSMNFFGPITEVLGDFGAEKVFVEGDALILSIFEHENMPEGGYIAARACGLALRILSIVRRYNERNKANHLPAIELGIGICYKKGQPAFLFDESNRIMISPAINIADRLSGCSRALRVQMIGKRKPHNLYLFQAISDEDMSSTSDDLYLRYNVNGIQLNGAGFEKLKKEIVLKRVRIHSAKDGEKTEKFYTGIYPMATGTFGRLVIREGRVPKVDPRTLEVISPTGNKYFEVCRNQKINDYIKKCFHDKNGGKSFK